MASDERLRDLEEKYEGYTVFDDSGEKIGKVDDLFVDEEDREEYIGVKMGFFGMKSTLIPMDVARVNERDRVIEVSESKRRVQDAPNFGDDEDITPDFEERIRSHFGLSGHEGSSRGSYGGRSSSATDTERGAEGGLDRDTDDDRELDVEGAPAGGSSRASEGSSEGAREQDTRERSGHEEHRDREEHTGSGSADTATSGAPSEPETGDRSAGSDPYREGYEEGLREAGREAARREAQGGGAGSEEHGGSDASTQTGSASDRDEPADRSGSPRRDDHETHDDERSREGERRTGEGERSESTSTRVWRRLSS